MSSHPTAERAEAAALEQPAALLTRLKLGREEFCQRLLTMLILDGPYPRWNTRSSVSPPGLEFLRTRYVRSFGEPWPGDELVFVDEFELPARHAAEPGGAPDWAVLWADRLWLIELKTEKGSHRPDQIPGYFSLAHYHYPAARVDISYVTPPMTAPYDPVGAWERYCHTPWAGLVPAITETWGGGPHRDHVEALDRTLRGLHLKPSAWRAAFLGPPAPAPAEQRAVPVSPEAEGLTNLVELAIVAAANTAEDGQQRGVEIEVGDLQTLLDLRVAVRNRIASTPAGSDLRRVAPWIWRADSTGKPLTVGGQKNGIELRVSRYKSPQYR
jgi:hypothetical protein